MDVSPQYLRGMVEEFRHPSTTEEGCQEIRDEWKTLGIPNQFAAMLRAAEIEKEV